MVDKQKLSALMDGESVDKAFIAELSQDAEGVESWRHFHLIGDVMRGDVAHKEWNIAENVALALENEVAHSLYTTQIDENVVLIESQPEPRKARRTLPAWLSHLGQVSIAASVCLAVVLGVQQTSQPTDAVDQSAIPVLQTVPLAGVAEPVSLTRESMQPQTTISDSQLQEQRRRVNALLQDYELQLRLNNDTHSGLVKNQESAVE